MSMEPIIVQPRIDGLSNEEYHRAAPYTDYLSSSQLKHYLRSPAAFKYAMEHPEPETDAMRFGSLFHDLMASLAEHKADWFEASGAWFENLAFFIPPTNPKTGQPYGATTKAYTESYQQFLAANDGRLIISEPDYALVTHMALSLLCNSGSTSRQVRQLLRHGTPEVSLFYETEDGIKIKCRPDLLTNASIVDWKSTNLDDFSEESINRAILRYGYHISAAMYQYIAHKILGRWLRFYLIFVSKTPPHDCIMVDMRHYGYNYDSEWDMVSMGPGADEFIRLLDLHTKCTKENHYPGAETFIHGDKYRIMKIEPPRWYANKFNEDI